MPDMLRRHPLAAVDLNLLPVLDVLLRERSVARAAQLLDRTPSAISHALRRLRALLGDELLVRHGNGMQPTPTGVAIGAELRQMLQAVEHVVRTREPFVPAQSERLLRVVVPDFTPRLFATLFNVFHSQAQHARLECLAFRGEGLDLVASGQADAALWYLGDPRAGELPLRAQEVVQVRHACVMRRSHPASRAWSRKAWLSSEHVNVMRAPGLPVFPQVVDEPMPVLRTTVTVETFCALPRLLEKADLVATVPEPVARWLARDFELIARKMPLAAEPERYAVFRAARSLNDGAVTWLCGVAAKAMQTVAGRPEDA